MDVFENKYIDSREFKEVPSAKRAGIPETKFKEMVSNPMRNHVALMTLVSDIDQELADSKKRFEADVDEDDHWKNPDALKAMVVGATQYLAGQKGLIIYAEHLVIAVFNDALEKAEVCRKEVEYLKKYIDSKEELLRASSVKDLISQSKRLALLEQKMEKSLMAHQYISTKKIVSFS